MLIPAEQIYIPYFAREEQKEKGGLNAADETARQSIG